MHATTIHDPTHTSSLLQGTPRWMSPEQMSRGIINKQTDVYSFGMTMYEVYLFQAAISVKFVSVSSFS